MNEQWLNENRTQLLSGIDDLIDDVRRNVARADNSQLRARLQEVEQQMAATEAALQAFGQQRHTLLQLLDAVQSELAVEGRPLPGEVS